MDKEENKETLVFNLTLTPLRASTSGGATFESTDLNVNNIKKFST
jgi:hypothetical protein